MKSWLVSSTVGQKRAWWTRMRRAIAMAMNTITLAFALGCQSDPATADQPAHRVGMTAAANQELARVVASALSGTAVTLAEDAFVHNSLLSLTNQLQQDVSHGRIIGRELQAPPQFRLVVNRNVCWLVHVNSQRRWQLHDVQCRAASP